MKMIRDPKPRLIAAAPIRDRVVHHAMYNLMSPVFTPSFIFDNYASLPGKGTHRAVLRFQHFMRTFQWVQKLDVMHYFPAISWDVVLTILGKRIKDGSFLYVCQRLLESAGYLHGNAAPFPAARDSHRQITRTGLPIGNLTSQFFGLLYLDELDHYIKRTLKIRGYVRYVDDMALFDDDMDRLRECSRMCATWLEENRGLYLHPPPAPIRCSVQRTTFLGYELSRRSRRMKAGSRRRFFRKLERLLDSDGPADIKETWRRSLEAHAGLALF
ncbi:RNA-directed DNA polymerase [bacterium]|nr:RNA-directed DNA polymerase [candidate division CSSED10-310 bacterium]